MRHRLPSPAMLSCVAVTTASPTIVSLIFEQFAAANVKALIFLYLVHTSKVRHQLRRSTVAIDATVLLRSCRTINIYTHEV